tara:strand:+ start:2199 stop:2549 length:351 start_codon:yes stop_codon:yes gene_type:complete
MKGILGSGTRDFIVVRITALVIFSYFSFLIILILLNSPFEFIFWKNLFGFLWVKIFSSIFLLSFALHTWIGTWAISSDYLTNYLMGSLSKPIKTLYNLFTTGIICIALFWSLIIIW